jgi:protein scribble
MTTNRNLTEIVTSDKLFLGGYKLNNVSDTIKLFTNVKYLNLANNNLRAIPDSISELRNLLFLNVDNNQIEELPAFLGNIPRE